MNRTIITICVILSGWGAFAQHDHAMHENQKQKPAFQDKNLETAYTHYIHLKEALVSSDQERAKAAAAELASAIRKVKGGEKVQSEATKVSQAKSLDDQRKAFTTLSNEMITLVKNSDITAGAVYLEYCPMANKNTGGFWLSNEKEIRNPYFGDKMLKCGTVKETIQ